MIRSDIPSRKFSNIGGVLLPPPSEDLMLIGEKK